MNENDPISRPSSVDPAVWETIPPGLRIRLLRRHELLMDREQHLELLRLPFWTFYGPEDGAPLEWFNPRGFLLPKYRPGGSSHGLFRSWRRHYRIRRYVRWAVRERTGQCWRDHQEWFWALLIPLWFVVNTALEHVLDRWYGDFAGGGLYFVVLLTGGIAGIFAFRLLGPTLARRYVEWRISRASRHRRQARPDGSSGARGDA